MKKKLLSLLLAMTIIGCTACGRTDVKETEQKAASEESENAEAESDKTEAESKETEANPKGDDASEEEQQDTDETAAVSKIAVTGPLTQLYVLPLASDMLVGVSNSFSEDAKLYLPSEIFNLPEIGQLYGGKGEMDLEALLMAAPDMVLDVGEAKEGIEEDMKSLTEQTQIPFVHVDSTVLTAADSYRTLGKMLGREEKAEELASWCESTLEKIDAVMAKVDADGARKTMLYCLGDAGINVMAKGSYHAETVNYMADNVAVLDEVVSSGMGNESDVEQIMKWDPDVIVFSENSIYDTVASEPQWQSVRAISEGNYYEAPYGPYGWLASPPSVQRYLGLLWLGEILYPDYVDYDLQEEVTGYYQLFYGCDLTDEMYQNLTKKALAAK